MINIQRQVELIKSLAKFSSMLNAEFELQAVLETICDGVTQVLDVEASQVALYDPKTETFSIAHAYGAINADDIKKRPYTLDMYNQFLLEGHPYRYISNVKDTLQNHPFYQFYVKFDVRSAIIVNLTYNSRLIGTVELTTIGRQRDFTDEELSFLVTVANQAAVTIDHVCLYRQVHNRVDELKIIKLLSSKLRLVDNPQEMLPILLNTAMELTQADAGSIYLLDSSKNPIHPFKFSRIPIQDEWFSPGSSAWDMALTSEIPIDIPVSPSLSEEKIDLAEIQRPILSAILLSYRSAHSLSAIMALGFTNPVNIDPQVYYVLSSMAEIGGNALQRSGFLEMLEKSVSDRSSDLNTLYDLSVYINSPIQYEEKLNGAVQKINTSVNADCGIIFRYDTDNEQLQLAGQYNLPLEVLTQVHQINVGLEFKNWLETSTIPWLYNRDNGQPSPMSVVDAGLSQTIIYLPIRFEGKVLGLLCILWKKPTDLSPENISLLIALTEKISSAVQNEILRQKSENATLLEERNRLARELHDSVTQSLYSQMLMAEAASDMLTQNKFKNLKSCLVDLRDNSLQTLKEMRLLLFELRPPQVGGHDLAWALQNRLDAVEGRAGVAASLDVRGTIHLPAKVQDELYSIALEALNNSLKHSGANTVQVMIHTSDRKLQLTIEDNGKGFTLGENLSAGMGLTTIRDRVNQLGGTLEIVTSPGNGTRVSVRLGLEGV